MQHAFDQTPHPHNSPLHRVYARTDKKSDNDPGHIWLHSGPDLGGHASRDRLTTRVSKFYTESLQFCDFSKSGKCNPRISLWPACQCLRLQLQPPLPSSHLCWGDMADSPERLYRRGSTRYPRARSADKHVESVVSMDFKHKIHPHQQHPGHLHP